MMIRLRAVLGTAWKIIIVVGERILSGQIVVDFVRHLIKVAGNIAESVFMLSAIYVTINNVAHPFLELIMPAVLITLLSQIAVIMLSVLPELVAANAIIKTYDHWNTAYIIKLRSEMLWAIAYTIPTVIFLTMTAITLASFTSTENSATIIPTATGVALSIRCLTGWYYGLLQMVYAERKRKSHTGHLIKLKGDLDLIRGELSKVRGDLTKMKSENTSLRNKLTRSKGDLQIMGGDLSSNNGHHKVTVI